MTYVGNKAPHFSCKAVMSGKETVISLNDLPREYKIIFFYPKDFTFVCPTELHALEAALPAFKERQVTILAVSTDTLDTHCRWLQTPKEQGGIQGITFPLLADPDKKMARAYGVLDEQEGVALRGFFVLDRDNVIQAQAVYNRAVGRDVAEIIRVVDAFQFVEKHGQLCPANWQTGEAGMEATTASVADCLKKQSKK